MPDEAVLVLALESIKAALEETDENDGLNAAEAGMLAAARTALEMWKTRKVA